MKERPLLVEKNNLIATLILNRPEKKNSLSPELVNLLLHTLEDLADDDTVRTLVIRGAGDTAFCSGYDIHSLPSKGEANVKERLKALTLVEALFDAITHFPYPVIAMINGMALGAGCELAICSDIRIGVHSARMGMPPAKLGIVYPWKGLQRFIRTIGLGSTRELFYTGGTYQGMQLKELGLVNHIVPAEEFETFTARIAEQTAANAPLALKGTKRVINLLLDQTALDERGIAEAESISEATFLSDDLKEGQLAFFEKRRPRFKGR